MQQTFGWWVEDRDRLHVMHLYGELDIAVAGRLKEALVGVGRSTVAVDLGRLDFIDATGLAAILSARDAIVADGSAFRMWGARGIVRRVFEVTGLVCLLDEQ